MAPAGPFPGRSRFPRQRANPTRPRLRAVPPGPPFPPCTRPEKPQALPRSPPPSPGPETAWTEDSQRARNARCRQGRLALFALRRLSSPHELCPSEAGPASPPRAKHGTSPAEDPPRAGRFPVRMSRFARRRGGRGRPPPYPSSVSRLMPGAHGRRATPPPSVSRFRITLPYPALCPGHPAGARRRPTLRRGGWKRGKEGKWEGGPRFASPLFTAARATVPAHSAR
jgi:hypothetical protein